MVLAFVTPSTHVIGVANGGYPPTEAPTAVATATPWPATLSVSQMTEALRLAGWPEAAIPEALRVFWCESNYNRYAVGAAGELGLAQLHPRWHLWRFDGDPFDPIINLRAALSLYNEQGWRPWSCK